MLLTCNEWEYFVTNGEDLSIDYSSAVKDFVKDFLGHYRKDAMQKIDEIQAQGDGLAQVILRMRWTQIIEAIDAFSGA